MSSVQNDDVHTTLKLINHKLIAVEYRLAAIDNKIDSLEKNICDVILRCLNKPATPQFWDQSTNLLRDIDKKSVCDTNSEEKFKVENDSLDWSILDSGSNINSILGNKNRETSIDIISSGFELISLLVGGTNNQPQNSSTSLKTQVSTNGEPSKKAKKGPNASQVLTEVSNFIQVSDRHEYITHYNAVIKFFINELKSDDAFKQIFKGEVMAGSYRDGLKISKPNEYDTILRLNFGDKKNIVVERVPGQPAHCMIKLNEYDFKIKPFLKPFLDSEGYLLQDAIVIWIQNILRRILKPYDENGKIIHIENVAYQYSHSINGPAFTFKINVQDTDIKFDMDLVPAIPFDYTHWVATRDYSRESNQINWIAVPKPPKGGLRRKNRSFICSYTEMEKHILKDLNQAKNFIRIFKKLRDNQQLKFLKSYFIKTIFLWQLDNTTVTKRKEYWSRSLDVIFLDMFKIIMDHVQKRELLFYWESDYNMFDTIPENKLKSCEDKLRGIYCRLETIMTDNPKGLLDIILNSAEKKIVEGEVDAKL